MKSYTQQELDYAVAVANKAWYQEWYELGRKHLQAIQDAPFKINF